MADVFQSPGHSLSGPLMGFRGAELYLGEAFTDTHSIGQDTLYSPSKRFLHLSHIFNTTEMQ